MQQGIHNDWRLWKDLVDGLIRRGTAIKDLLVDATQAIAISIESSVQRVMRELARESTYGSRSRNLSSSIVTLS